MSSNTSESSPFVTATTWSPLGEGRYLSHIRPEWFQGRGAFGGMLGGSLLRSMMRELNEPARAPRSLTVHFCAPVTEGEATLSVRLERAGRQVTHLSARVEQAGQVACLASATFALSRDTPLVYTDAKPPRAPPPSDVRPMSSEMLPTFAAHFDYRWCVGAVPFSGAKEARLGGWIRPRVPTPLDAPLVVGLLDSYPPAALTRVEGFCNGATVDYTAHFYAPLPLASASPEAFYLRTGLSRHAAEGYADDLAELWSEDGQLIAQLRQVAAVFPQGR
ncbi:acyl-CoA thioesterase II [Vitiosangium sp. GDMCC 1.1324]|uniref:acyl-CoA thioesterase n=1 Tax=Vitiosangium sp. (strain GDMCC 1.1324) TaxID=2138576 RepID=UPI000D36E1E1|nr:thioesterase family protein [Vitiosangium sp. GDMCC 1.1324]PTL77108.1 thioesterase family protein [Vitiosangium sp. GDMCC 1.1324]